MTRRLPIVASLLLFLSGIAGAQPYYRFFRGKKRADLSSDLFVSRVNAFVPQVAMSMRILGAVAYLPALPPLVKPAGIADEYAIVGFPSEEAYRRAMRAPEGKRYLDLHWEVFESTSTGTRTGPALPLGEAMEGESAYDVLGRDVDWASGVSAFFIGSSKAGMSAGEFLGKLSAHVRDFRDACAPLGLDGYVVLSGGDYEVAYTHWKDAAAYQAAFASGPCRGVADRASELFDSTPVMFTTAAPAGTFVTPGVAVNVTPLLR